MAANSRTPARKTTARPPRPTRDVAPVDEISPAQAQETEAEGHYVTGLLCDEELRIIPPGAWRQSWQRLLNDGRVDAFAQLVMPPEDYDQYVDIDPTNDEFGEFIGDAASRRREPGKVAWIRDLVEAHAEAVEADLARYYPRDADQIAAFWLGTMSSRRLRVLIQGLPPESLTITAMRNALTPEEYAEQAANGKPEEGRWSSDQQLLAAVVDAVRELQYITVVANSDGKGRKPKRPDPMRRPGVGGPKPREELTDQHADFLFNMINGGAA